MTPIKSAGMLMYRMQGNSPEVFLCIASSYNKHDRWGIPKGRLKYNEPALEAATREFQEETGLKVPKIPKFYLGTFVYPTGKKSVSVWTFEYNPPADFKYHSNTVKRISPDGKEEIVPEIADWEWFTIEEARMKIMPHQKEVIERFSMYIEKYMEIKGNG